LDVGAVSGVESTRRRLVSAGGQQAPSGAWGRADRPASRLFGVVHRMALVTRCRRCFAGHQAVVAVAVA